MWRLYLSILFSQGDVNIFSLITITLQNTEQHIFNRNSEVVTMKTWRNTSVSQLYLSERDQEPAEVA